MKTAGYCALLAVALGLFVVMCAILRDATITHDISARGQAESSVHGGEPPQTSAEGAVLGATSKER